MQLNFQSLSQYSKVLSETPIREVIASHRQAASKSAKQRIFDGDSSPQSQMDKVAQLSGIEVYEKRCYHEDYDKYHCAEFVFLNYYKLTEERTSIGHLTFWDSILEYLYENGFSPTQFPQKDDVILYYSSDSTDSPQAKHVGVFLEQNTIVSKFEAGHIFKHKIECVSDEYGDRYMFFHKEA